MPNVRDQDAPEHSRPTWVGLECRFPFAASYSAALVPVAPGCEVTWCHTLIAPRAVGSPTLIQSDVVRAPSAHRLADGTGAYFAAERPCAPTAPAGHISGLFNACAFWRASLRDCNYPRS
jgi:hypothetical protein